MASIEVTDELLMWAKNSLDVTWSDTATDQKIVNMLQRGMSYIIRKTGVDTSAFSGELVIYEAQELLYNYLLYARAGSVNEFERNYLPDITALKIRTEVKRADETEPEG